MEDKRPRSFVALEIGGAFFLAMFLIWVPPLVFGERPIGKILEIGLGVILAAGIVTSYILRKDSWDTIGLIKETKPLWLFTLISFLAIGGIALLVNPGFWKQPEIWDKIFQRLGYPFWALFQQLLMQGYGANRCGMVFQKRWQAALAVGILFGIAHLPNPILAPATFILGTVAAYYFLKCRNLYIIAFMHAILAVAVKYFLTDDLLNHGMRVGPGFWE